MFEFRRTPYNYHELQKLMLEINDGEFSANEWDLKRQLAIALSKATADARGEVLGANLFKCQLRYTADWEPISIDSAPKLSRYVVARTLYHLAGRASAMIESLNTATQENIEKSLCIAQAARSTATQLHNAGQIAKPEFA
jgi:hypothetical protein